MFSVYCFLLPPCLCALIVCSRLAIPQDTGGTKDLAETMPHDPNELMLLAAKVNGLTADNVKPWHLRATYKLLDEKGNSTDQGVYEEFWVSPTKFKRTFTGNAFIRVGTTRTLTCFSLASLRPAMMHAPR